MTACPLNPVAEVELLERVQAKETALVPLHSGRKEEETWPHDVGGKVGKRRPYKSRCPKSRPHKDGSNPDLGSKTKRSKNLSLPRERASWRQTEKDKDKTFSLTALFKDGTFSK